MRRSRVYIGDQNLERKFWASARTLARRLPSPGRLYSYYSFVSEVVLPFVLHSASTTRHGKNEEFCVLDVI